MGLLTFDPTFTVGGLMSQEDVAKLCELTQTAIVTISDVHPAEMFTSVFTMAVLMSADGAVMMSPHSGIIKLTTRNFFASISPSGKVFVKKNRELTEKIDLQFLHLEDAVRRIRGLML